MEVLRRENGNCQRCGGRAHEVHHRFYREDWNDTKPDDCEALCRECHSKQHPDKGSLFVRPERNCFEFNPIAFKKPMSARKRKKARKQWVAKKRRSG